MPLASFWPNNWSCYLLCDETENEEPVCRVDGENAALQRSVAEGSKGRSYPLELDLRPYRPIPSINLESKQSN